MFSLTRTVSLYCFHSHSLQPWLQPSAERFAVRRKRERERERAYRAARHRLWGSEEEITRSTDRKPPQRSNRSLSLYCVLRRKPARNTSAKSVNIQLQRDRRLRCTLFKLDLHLSIRIQNFSEYISQNLNGG